MPLALLWLAIEDLTHPPPALCSGPWEPISRPPNLPEGDLGRLVSPFLYFLRAHAYRAQIAGREWGPAWKEITQLPYRRLLRRKELFQGQI